VRAPPNAVMGSQDRASVPCEHVTALLDVHAADLDQRIVELTVLREEVDRLRQRAQDLDPAACTADSVCHLIPVSSTGSVTPDGSPDATPTTRTAGR
jgi:MerR family transcriptional regulator, copper efflux regulator